MPTLPPAIIDKIAARHGIVTTRDLLDAGLSRYSINDLSQYGVLKRQHSGVYLVATSELTFEARCVAACLADDDAVITGPAAARLWRFRHVFHPNVPDVLVRHDTTPIARGVTLRRTDVLDDEDVVVRPDGIRVASPPRAWFDCAAHLSDDAFEMLTEWVLDEHCPISALYRTTRRLEARGRGGLARVDRVLSRRASWQKPAQSGLETKVLRALRRGGVSGLVDQYEITLPNGMKIHADAADPSIGWALEIDHVTWHGGRFEAQRDKSRDRQCRKAGWLVERATDQALRDDFRTEVVEIADSHRLRCSEAAA